MSIPAKVKIGGIEYEVKEVDEVDPRNQNIDGRICYHHQELRIKRGMGKDYTEKILVHEVVHGILDFCMIEKWEGSEEENFAERFANTLHQVLKDNDLTF